MTKRERERGREGRRRVVDRLVVNFSDASKLSRNPYSKSRDYAFVGQFH
jgi:hypothetical protein